MLLNIIRHQQLDVGKVYLYIKYTFESKFQLLIKNKLFTNKFYENLEYYNPKKRKKDMITDMEGNKRLKLVVAELFMRGRKLSIADFLYHNLILHCLKVKDKHDALFYCENK